MKKNLIIGLAFLIPIVFILVVALFTYWPRISVSTDYDFIYLTCDDTDFYRPNRPYRPCQDYLNQQYEVENNKLVVNPFELDHQATYHPRFFYHDTKRNESREIALVEAEVLSLSEFLTSPDGVTISFESGRHPDLFCLFGCETPANYYLTKGRDRNRLNLINFNDSYYPRDNFHFLGWVYPTELLDHSN